MERKLKKRWHKLVLMHESRRWLWWCSHTMSLVGHRSRDLSYGSSSSPPKFIITTIWDTMQHRSWKLHFVEMDAEIPAITSFCRGCKNCEDEQDGMDIHEMNFHCFITFMKYFLLASIYCCEAFEVNLPAVKWFGSW